MRGFQRSIFGILALGRSGWRVQAAIAFGDETTSPRAGVFLLQGPKP